ncbi:hypothetical protein [Azospirillum sp. Sh1]|nr:hypothetical protein [Azospirillum sp. Sh1]
MNVQQDTIPRPNLNHGVRRNAPAVDHFNTANDLRRLIAAGQWGRAA